MKNLRNYLWNTVRSGIGLRMLLFSSVAAASSSVDTTFTSNRLDLHWNSVPGQLQQVQVSTDLVHWTNLPPVMASVFSNSAWSDDGSLTGSLFDSHQHRFYRLSLLPQTLNQSVSVPVTFLPPMAGSSYTWDFGDGTTSTSNAPTHTYSFDGTYKVVSSVTDGNGTHYTTNTVLAEAPSQILLTPAVLAGLRQKAASNTAQWNNFKSRLDNQLNSVIGDGAYEGSELQWIGDYALGYKVLEFQDPPTAAKYADKAIGIMQSALQDFQKVGEISQQFLGRGDGVTKVFTLPNTNIVASSLDVFIAPISITTVTNHGVTDQLDYNETFIKVSNTPDGSVDYREGIDWRHNGDLDNSLIDWSIAAPGHKPALNSVYYVTVASSFDVVDASPTLSGNKITFATAPTNNTAIYVQYVYGVHASDYSTLAFQQTHANDGGFNSITIDDGYTSRYLGKFTSMGYDWLYGYPGFSSTFRNQVGTMLVRWSDYWKTNGYRADNPASNYSEGGYASRVLTALALSGGRNTNATRLVSEILAFRQANVLPLITSPSNSLAGGFWAEGWNYGPQAARNLVLSGLSLETAGMITATPERNWAGQVIPSLIAEQPTTNTIYDGGDWYDYPTPFPEKDLLYIMAAATTDATARSNANYMIQSYSGGQMQDMQDMIFRDPTAGAASWTNTAPLERFAQGTGLIIARTDWSYNSTMVSFQLGNLLDTDHQTYCQGQLEIWRGGNGLLINANEVGENQIPSTESGFGNTLDIDDNGAGTQVYRFNQGDWYGTPGCRILNYEATNGYVYANGDYAAAYGLNTNPGHGTATKLTRQVVYERPDFVFVHDRGTTKAANDPKQLRWHFLKPASINAATNSWVATNGTSKLFAQTFSRSALTTAAGSVDCNGSTVYRVTTINSVNASNVTYVTALQTAPSTTATMTNTVPIYSTDSRMEGVQMGSRVVMFGADVALNPFTNSVSYTVSGSAPVSHLITDLQPNHAFTVSAGGTSLGTFTSSAQGTLTFTNTPSGSQTIIIQ